jgi:hypothetical protein
VVALFLSHTIEWGRNGAASLGREMPVGRIDDDDEELVDDSLNAGLLAPPSTAEEGGSCSRPICFGALVIGLLAFGVRFAAPS